MRFFRSVIAISLAAFQIEVAVCAEQQLEHFLNTGHSSVISDVAISSDGAYLVTVGYDSKAILWKTESGKKIREFSGHEGRIFSVAMADDGKSFVTGSYDQTAILWDAATGKQLQKFKHSDWVWNVTISPDGKLVATGAEDGRAILWNAATGKKIRTIVRVEGGSPEVAISANNNRIVTMIGTTLATWDATTGKKLRDFEAEDDVWDIAISSDGKHVLGSLLLSDRAVLWDAVTGKVVRRYDTGGEDIRSIRLSRDNRRMLIGTANDKASLWDISTAKRIQTFAGDSPYNSDMRCVALSADGTTVVTVTDGQRTSTQWDVKTGKPLRTFGMIASTDRDLTLSDDGKYLAIGTGNSASIWDTATARRVQHLLGHEQEVYRVALSANGKLAVTGSADQTAILWDVGTGKKLKSFVAHDDSVNSVGISNDGKLVMTSSSGDGTAILWDAETGKKFRMFQGKIKPDDASNRFSAAGLSPDGRFLVTGAYDSTVTFWDANTGKKLAENSDHHSQKINSIAFSRDGKRVVTSSWANLNVWETAKGKQLYNVRQLVGFTCVAINGNLLLAGTEDNTTQIREASSGKHLRTLRGHTDPIWGTAISNDGKFAWTASGDGTTRLWRLRDSNELLRLTSFDQADDWLAITPDGYFDGSDEAWTLISYRESSSGKLIDGQSMRKLFHRKGDLMEQVK